MTPLIQMIWAEGADKSLPLPTYETAGAAGADLRANLAEADRPAITLEPGARRLVPHRYQSPRLSKVGAVVVAEYRRGDVR